MNRKLFKLVAPVLLDNVNGYKLDQVAKEQTVANLGTVGT